MKTRYILLSMPNEAIHEKGNIIQRRILKLAREAIYA
jgi:hypothetical protein